MMRNDGHLIAIFTLHDAFLWPHEDGVRRPVMQKSSEYRYKPQTSEFISSIIAKYGNCLNWF
jgi:hypothetical protein